MFRQTARPVWEDHGAQSSHTTRLGLAGPTIKLMLLFLAAALVFSYDQSAPLDVRQISSEPREGVEVRDLSFANATGARTKAYLVRPPARGHYAGVLFVHWYEPKSADSNRTQFLTQAIDLGKSGTVSLLIETMWSEPKWFNARHRAGDYRNSRDQVKNLRRALDMLLSIPDVDRQRIAYVGHDFGAMYGAVLAGVDRRPKAWALQAGTTSFSDWFLLGEKLDAAERQRVIEKLAPLDPIRFIGEAKPAPVLLQFGRLDEYVPAAKAQAFFDSAREPKDVKYYDAGHALNAAAVRDRQNWLREKLGLQTRLQ